jgi:hypothetical protein
VFWNREFGGAITGAREIWRLLAREGRHCRPTRRRRPKSTEGAASAAASSSSQRTALPQRPGWRTT